MANEQSSVVESLKDMTIEDLHDLSNIFSSEFNCGDIHDRVLCFKIIKDEELVAKDDSEDDSNDDSEDNSESGSDTYDHGEWDYNLATFIPYNIVYLRAFGVILSHVSYQIV